MLACCCPFRRRRELFAGGVVAEIVVGRAFFRIFQRGVGFRHFLEFFFAGRILGNIRVVLVRQLAIGLLDLFSVASRATPMMSYNL